VVGKLRGKGGQGKMGYGNDLSCLVYEGGGGEKVRICFLEKN